MYVDVCFVVGGMFLRFVDSMRYHIRNSFAIRKVDV